MSAPLASLFGTRAPLAVDLFLVVVVAILPLLLASVALVRRGRIRAHAAIMVGCFAAFLLALVFFELAVRRGGPAPARWPFRIHLAVAFPCTALWIAQILRGRRAIAEPRAHRLRGKAILLLFALTSATGVWLYVATFA